MKLEHQVVSLELAKKLKELGVKQESLYWWVNRFPWSIQRHEEGRWSRARTHSAFTVAELGEKFPAVIRTGLTLSQVGTGRTTNQQGFGCALVDANRITIHKGFQANTEADARAKMLVYLLENNLVAI